MYIVSWFFYFIAPLRRAGPLKLLFLQIYEACLVIFKIAGFLNRRGRDTLFPKVE
ncbi:hypothetical protein Dhaf_2555 [Desulfitobacterium hafniense DCB-2]|uniref:Uncharacterized protein n=1 Tax=Desulfitobacterium hafniense (strain DSM 10664 / DCB-2) TaxID=272564 RepID=B8FV73_DESHD|nr:hypothetical protein Dhaf_2555 [Desulfitobacterium hafniense DCB-2]